MFSTTRTDFGFSFFARFFAFGGALAGVFGHSAANAGRLTAISQRGGLSSGKNFPFRVVLM
jgi:hypothetical protein